MPGQIEKCREDDGRNEDADRAEHGRERDERDCEGCEPLAVAEPAGEPSIGGIERDGEQDRPDHDRREWADEFE